MFDLDDVPVEMKDNPVVSRSCPGTSHTVVDRRAGTTRVGERSFGGDSTSVGWSKSNVAVNVAAGREL